MSKLSHAGRMALIAGTAGMGAALLAPIAPAVAQATYTNPVLMETFADPAVLRVGNTLYAYATGGNPGAGGPTPFIRMSKSTNFVNWNASTTVLARPTWATGEFWAPHVLKDPSQANRYVMYFTAKGNTSHPQVPANSDKCLGTATASSPEGPFTPAANPIQCDTGIQTIDPMAFYNPQQRKTYLYWGSGQQPIKMRELSADLLGFAPGSVVTTVISPIAGDKYSKLIEGSWLIDRGNYRYLFMSGSGCCSGDDAYAITVARQNIQTGGAWERYTGGDRGAIVKMNGAWAAPGHNGTFTDGAGNFWLIYHARRPGSDGSGPRYMLIDKILWQNGWPRIAGDSPSNEPKPVPVPY